MGPAMQWLKEKPSALDIQLLCTLEKGECVIGKGHGRLMLQKQKEKTELGPSGGEKKKKKKKNLCR